jgi:hypothetical protein
VQIQSKTVHDAQESRPRTAAHANSIGDILQNFKKEKENFSSKRESSSSFFLPRSLGLCADIFSLFISWIFLLFAIFLLFLFLLSYKF